MMAEEGRIIVEGYQIWYRRIGNGSVPLLTLHGGPGAGHDYLQPLEQLRRSVVFYDQLGCGKSARPKDDSLWKIERFASQINLLRQALGLTHIHLFGQSYGGWLAIEYMLSHPLGVVSLVLASTSGSVPQYISEMSLLKARWPPKVYEILQRYEAVHDFRHPNYEAAYLEFLKQYMCRLDPWPESLVRTTNNVKAFAGYETMWGSNEFEPTGNLRTWDCTDRLSEIRVPTLITVGRYDEMTPKCAETLHKRISTSHVVVFEESAHVAHLEETRKYLEVVNSFLEKVENSRQQL
jgi:proline-specific peptidase